MPGAQIIFVIARPLTTELGSPDMWLGFFPSNSSALAFDAKAAHSTAQIATMLRIGV